VRKKSARLREVARTAMRPRWELLRAWSVGMARGRGAAISVPLTIHHIWLGLPMPADADARRRAWQLANPGWDVRRWTEANIPPDARPELFERLRTPAERADLLRLAILRRHGGVVVDPRLSVRPLAPFLPDAGCFAAAAPGGTVTTAVLGAAAGHPAIEAVIAEQRPREWSGYDPDATGAGAVARARAAGAEIVLVPGFDDPGDSVAGRRAVLESVLAVEAELVELERRAAALRRETAAS
jgi:hypothetical protein